MLWQRPRETTFHNGPGAPVDLRSMAGLAGRLLFADGAGGPMTSVPCTVLEVNRTHMVIQLEEAEAPPAPETAVILEIVQQSALIQCFTVVHARLSDDRLSLRKPGRPHVIQRRRFPRVDIFLGVTLCLEATPMEQTAAQMINLSLDGAACVLVEPLAPGTSVRLNLGVTGLHPPVARAVTVRCTPTPGHLWVAGLKFDSLTEEQELYLGKYISSISD